MFSKPRPQAGLFRLNEGLIFESSFFLHLGSHEGGMREKADFCFFSREIFPRFSGTERLNTDRIAVLRSTGQYVRRARLTSKSLLEQTVWISPQMWHSISFQRHHLFFVGVGPLPGHFSQNPTQKNVSSARTQYYRFAFKNILSKVKNAQRILILSSSDTAQKLLHR